MWMFAWALQFSTPVKSGHIMFIYIMLALYAIEFKQLYSIKHEKPESVSLSVRITTCFSVIKQLSSVLDSSEAPPTYHPLTLNNMNVVRHAVRMPLSLVPFLILESIPLMQHSICLLTSSISILFLFSWKRKTEKSRCTCKLICQFALELHDQKLTEASIIE